MSNKENEVPVRSTNVTSSDVTFRYPILDKYITDKAFKLTGVVLPNALTSRVEKVYETHSPTPQYLHNKQRNSSVEFQVRGRPCDTPEGRKLIKQSFELVHEVQKGSYKPANATIITLKKDGKKDRERQVNDCVLTRFDLDIDKDAGTIDLVYYMQGLVHD